MKPLPDPHHRHRFPAELISHAVWLYCSVLNRMTRLGRPVSQRIV